MSISQPYIRPIVRGKVKSPVEFGAKLDMSIDEHGFARLERLSFDAYNESDVLIAAIKRYLERVLVDQIYRNRKNRAFCKSKEIRISDLALGCPKKDPISEERKTIYKDNTARIEVERGFSLAKRCCGLGLLKARHNDSLFNCALDTPNEPQKDSKFFCAVFLKRVLYRMHAKFTFDVLRTI